MARQDAHLAAGAPLAAAQVERAAVMVERKRGERCDALARPLGRCTRSPDAESKGIDVGRRRRALMERVVPFEQWLNPVDLVRGPPAARGAGHVRVEPWLVREHRHEYWYHSACVCALQVEPFRAWASSHGPG